MKITEDSKSISKPEKESLIGSLRWLYNESIGQAGRRLADQLDQREYMRMSGRDFFMHCYSLRSKLVHGNVSAQTREEVDKAVPDLESFVGDLLSGKLLQLVSY